MKHRWTYLAALAVLFALVLGAAPASAGSVDLDALISETQKTSSDPDKMVLLWWIPEEFWAETFKQSPDVSENDAEEFLTAVRPYTMLVVIDANIGSYGGMTYKSESWVRSNTKLIDEAGNAYEPIPRDKLTDDSRTIIDVMQPIIANMLGPLGENMHFLLYPAKSASGMTIAPATQKGRFKVELGAETFEWRLPVDSLLPVKVCAGCGENCKGSWTYCPWCGGKL